MRKFFGVLMLLVGLFLVIGVAGTVFTLNQMPPETDAAFRAGYMVGRAVGIVLFGWLAWRALQGGWRRLTTDDDAR